MGSCLKKYITRAFIFSVSLTVIILLFLVAFFVATTFFSLHKEKIEQHISSCLNQKISIESIYYFPPCFIILKNTSIFSNDSGFAYPPLFIKRITLVFSIKELISNKNITISKIYFVKPKIDFFKYPFFLKENIEGIIKVINLLAKNRPLRIVIEDAAFILDRKGNILTTIKSDIKIKIGPGRFISSSGLIDLCRLTIRDDLKKSKKNALKYNFYGSIINEGIEIGLLNFEKGDFRAAFKGNLRKNVLKLKGTSTFKNFFYTSSPARPGIEFINKIKKLMLYGRIPKGLGISPGGLNILGIKCVVEFASQKIRIDKMNFYLNNIPIGLDGDIAFVGKTLIALNISTFPDQPVSVRAENPKRFDGKIIGQLKGKKFNGKFKIGFLKVAGKEKIPQAIEAVLKNASFGFSPDGRIKLFATGVSFAYKSDHDLYTVFLENFDALFNVLNKRVKFVKFNSEIYDGFLKGYAAIDLAYLPLKTNFNLAVEAVNMHELDSLLRPLFRYYRKLPARLEERIYGKFACKINYGNYPESRLKGVMEIKDGYLDNLQFFGWLSDFFRIPALKKVSFKRIFAEFTVTDEMAALNKISLDAEEVQLAGVFSLEKNELVSGKLSLGLARKLLNSSPKFKLLLGLMDRKISTLNFDFQLSGLYNSINFKWLESDFKRKVKKMLPGFMERGIEKKIERAIRSITAL